MTAYRSFDEVPLFAFDFIMADPNWSFDNWSEKGEAKNAKAQYDCSAIDKIMAVRVGDMAAPNCVLWLWATNPMLPQAMMALEAWGFTFVTAGHWVKTTANDALSYGPGYVLRSCGEPYLIAAKTNGEPVDGRPFLIGKVGAPATVAKNVPSVILGERREHSRKPEAAYDAAERMLPDARRLDLYSRQARDGWDCAGNEHDKFDAEAA